MEFGFDLKPKFMYHSRGKEFSNTHGETWPIKHSYIAVNAYPSNESGYASEGMNIEGFTVSALWFEGFAYYLIKEKTENHLIHFASFVDYLLGNYSSVESAISDVNANKVAVWAKDKTSAKGFPLHFIIHDKHGKSGVIEFTEFKTYAVVNQTHVCTNSPDFEWHLNNLQYYRTLSTWSSGTSTLNTPIGVEPELFANGSGLRGIPGDFFPASRFVRTYYSLKFALQSTAIPQNSTDALLLAGHLLNDVDIPLGLVQNKDEPTALVHTQWIAVKDLIDLKFLYRTYKSFGFTVIDLKSVIWDEMHGQTQQLIDVPLYIPSKYGTQ
jgi:choloylglycine hydrolase